MIYVMGKAGRQRSSAGARTLSFALALAIFGLLPPSPRAEVPPPGRPATGGPSLGARYPIHIGGPYVSRYPQDTDFDIPPTLEQLNKVRGYDFDPRAGIHLDGFTLWTVDDLGFHDPAQQQYVRLTGRNTDFGDYHLIVHLKEAPAITDLFFYVRYHAERYHPERIEPGSAFGFDGDRLWFSMLEVPGLVCAGMTRVRPDINGGIKIADGVVCSIDFAKRPFDAEPRWLEHAPDHERNKVRNVTVYEQPDDARDSTGMCDITLYWEEANAGDFNNDGEVSMVDLIPVGRRYGRISTDAQEDEWDRLPDGNKDGEINYRDVWEIDQNYGALLQGYRVYRRPADRPRHEEVLLSHRTTPILPMSLHRPRDWDPIRLYEYRFYDRELPRSDTSREWIYRIVPYDALDDREGEGSDTEVTVRVTADSVTLETVE